MIPVGKHFCAPEVMTLDVALIKRCAYSEDATTCVDGCKWRAGLTVAKNDQVAVGMPLYENNICHPPTTDRWDELAPNCLSEMSKVSCEQKGQCVWSTGKRFIPPTDFCSTSEVSTDALMYSTCWNVDTAANCVGQCQWNKAGKYDLPETVSYKCNAKPGVNLASDDQCSS
jgi:hypothetical protein